MKRAKFYIHFIGLGLFAVILYEIDAIKTFSLIKEVDLCYLSLSILLIFPIIFLRNLRWQYILKNEKIEIGFKESFLIYFYAIFWGAVTPGSLGEFSKIIFLNRKKVSWVKSASSVIIDRLFDIITILILGLLSIIFFFKNFTNTIHLLSLVLILFGSVIILLYYDRKIFVNIFSKILKKLPKTISEKISKEDIENFFTSFKKPLLLIASSIFLSLSAWFLYFFSLYSLSLALGLGVSFLVISAAIATISILNLLPISISGIGTRDLALIVIFSQIGLEKEKAVAFSLLILMTFILNALFGWLAGFFIEKDPLKVSPSDIT